MEVTLYKGSVGINNKTAPHRLQFGDNGVSALEEATDVLVDHTGEIVTVRADTLVESGEYHSTFKTVDGFYVAKGESLYKATVDSDGALEISGIWSGMVDGARFSYASLDGQVFYTNGYQHGILDGMDRLAWPNSEWTGADDNREFIETPVGRHIGLLSGRFLVSVGSELFVTEYGLPGIVDGVKGRRRFEGDIIMICPVQSGAYVSTPDAVYFLQGTNPDEWSVRKVLDYPAIEYGTNDTLVDPTKFGLETNALSALFATVNGPVIGLPDGTPLNLIDKNIKMPDDCRTQTGSIIVLDDSMIIQSGE